MTKNVINNSKILNGYIVIDKCVQCRSCVDVCLSGAINHRRKPVYIDQEKCKACGSCYAVCDKKAIIKIGL